MKWSTCLYFSREFIVTILIFLIIGGLYAQSDPAAPKTIPGPVPVSSDVGSSAAESGEQEKVTANSKLYLQLLDLAFVGIVNYEYTPWSFIGFGLGVGTAPTVDLNNSLMLTQAGIGIYLFNFYFKSGPLLLKIDGKTGWNGQSTLGYEWRLKNNYFLNPEIVFWWSNKSGWPFLSVAFGRRF